MHNERTVTIIGLGLIGGSMAKALKKYRQASRIYAVDPDAAVIAQALKEDVIHAGFSNVEHNEVLDSDLIFICTPVKIALETLGSLDKKVKKDCILSDVCSTKTELVNAIERNYPTLNYIGGHPMTGREKSGFSYSSEDLFLNTNYILTRCNTTTEQIFSTLFEIVAGIGANPVELNALEHDLSTACISHMPHLVAFTLVDLIRRKDSKGLLKLLAAGGFKDITRVASSDPQMWESIFVTNKEFIIGLMDDYMDILESLKQWITANDSQKIVELIAASRDYRNTIP